MYKSRKLLHVLAFVMLTIMLPIIILNGITTKAIASTASISDNEVILEVGETKQLEITGTNHKVSWASNNRNIASVSYGGKVTAKKPGTITITAFVGDERLTCKVTVIKPIQLSSSSLALEIGEAKTLKITGTSDKVTWSSNNTSVATVSSNGKVTAKAAGQAVITAAVNGREKTSIVSVLQMLPTAITLEKGDTTTLSVSGTSDKITWSSSNSLVASVSMNGKVTAKAVGTATITAYVSGKRFSTVITVKQPIRLNHSWTTLSKGDTLDLDILGTNSKVTWTSSKPNVATISEAGIIKAKTKGMTKITAEVEGIRFHIVITVK